MNEAMVTDVTRELREFAKAGLRDSGARHRLRLLERGVTLRGLAPVQLAGGDSKAQYEYLVQAIVDALDAVGLPRLRRNWYPRCRQRRSKHARRKPSAACSA